VIAVDTNILLYAHREESPWHAAAFRELANLAEGRSSWAVPAPCFHEFLAIATHPRIFDPPTPLASAVDFVAALLEAPSLAILAEGEGYWPFLQKLVITAQVIGPKVHDARIAALCLYHRVDELWTADRDFGRFPEVRVRNPLVPR
jgi:toxin-antitoxin system PIN domain toxin